MRASISSIILLIPVLLEAQPKDHPHARLVDPFIGTAANGHCTPAATVPFGMVQPGPDTHLPDFNKNAYPWCAGYQYGDNSIIGFSQTHFSGTGHSDMGDVLIMPTAGPLQFEAGPRENPDLGYRSHFLKESERAEPGYYRVQLDDHGITAEMTATARTAFYRFTYPAADSARILLDLTQSIYNYTGKVMWSSVRVEGGTLVTGYRQTRGWARDRKIFFAIRSSKPFDTYVLANEEDVAYRGFGISGRQLRDWPEQAGRAVKAAFSFKTVAGETVLIKIGISAVSAAGALANMDTEIPHWNFDRVRTAALDLWEHELAKADIDAPQRAKRSFYTALYHTMLAPVVYMDSDRRYRGLDGGIHTARDFDNYTIYSLWDTYRAAHPLFTLLQPKRVPGMIRSMLAHADQSAHGMLPVWSFHANETWCMIGYHAVSVIADAYLKGIRGFDPRTALETMTRTARHAAYGGLGDYMRLGYVAQDREREGASKTLEYAYDDWTIAQLAAALGRKSETDEFTKRAASFRSVWDPGTGFMRARKSDGSWNEPFDPVSARYGGDYTEGNAWQYAWYVPHDVRGLIGLFGGNTAFIAKLDSLFVVQGDEEKYRHVEDISGLIGQYAHGNEPSQHIAYLYAWAGAPWKTQEKIRRIMTGLFDDTPAGIPGNEDCGQMSAWYIFSSLGFYPVCPGSGEYVIGTPALAQARLHLDNGKEFRITARGLDDRHYYIRSAKLNGKLLERTYITHAEIVRGGKLEFEMSDIPNPDWAAGAGAAPYSMTK